MGEVSYFVSKSLNQSILITAVKAVRTGIFDAQQKHTIIQIFVHKDKKPVVNSLGWDEYVTEEVKDFCKLIIDNYVDENEWKSRVIPMTLLSIYLETNDFKIVQVKSLLKLK
jgi:hypothetical protein